MNWWGIQHKYTPNDNKYIFLGQKKCDHTECRKKASQKSNRSFKDCMPDINLVWILEIDNSGLDQHRHFFRFLKCYYIIRVFKEYIWFLSEKY